MIAAQVAAEGAKRIIVVTDEPDKYSSDIEWPKGLTIHHRDDLDALQRELATVSGVSILIYDQTCAAEKRRRRKRGTFPDPDKRVIINDLVCEGCGDCGVKIELRFRCSRWQTEWGRKRTIDQSSCNKDYLLREGLLPVLRYRAWRPSRKRAKAIAEPAHWPALPSTRMLPLINHPYGIIVTGIGGTGIVTIGGVAWHGGASGRQGRRHHRHGRPRPERRRGLQPYPHRQQCRTTFTPSASPRAGADLVLGGDIVVAGNKRVLAAVKPGNTRDDRQYRRVPARRFHAQRRLLAADRETAGALSRRRRRTRESGHFIDATRLATALLGNSIGANMFMLGYAYQNGGLPLSAGSRSRRRSR